MKRTLSTLCLGMFLTTSAFAGAEDFASPTIGVGVIVSDLEKSLAFYTDVIGMIRTGSFDVNEEFSKKSGLANGVPLHVEVLRLAEGEQATQWKLMTFGDRATSQKNQFIYDHTGMQYITILVNDLTPFVERIKKHKVKLLGETPTPLGTDRHFVLVKDPDGTFVELIGPMK